MKARFYLLFGLILVLGCKDDKFVPLYVVPAEFQVHVDSFLKEASLRGFQYKIDNLIIRYDSTLVSPVCGNCNVASKDNSVQKIISINSKYICWTNDEEMEALTYHELGHCFLGRQHLTDTLPNGDPKSIMTPNNNVLYPPCEYAINGNPCDKRFKREYYVNELFDPSTPVPDWAK